MATAVLSSEKAYTQGNCAENTPCTIKVTIFTYPKARVLRQSPPHRLPILSLCITNLKYVDKYDFLFEHFANRHRCVFFLMSFIILVQLFYLNFKVLNK